MRSEPNLQSNLVSTEILPAGDDVSGRGKILLTVPNEFLPHLGGILLILLPHRAALALTEKAHQNLDVRIAKGGEKRL